MSEITRLLAELDLACAYSFYIKSRNEEFIYCRPEFNNISSYEIEHFKLPTWKNATSLENGRNIEPINKIKFSALKNVVIFEGNNGYGKSTLSRAIALNIVLVQAGCLPVCDKFNFTPLRMIFFRSTSLVKLASRSDYICNLSISRTKDLSSLYSDIQTCTDDLIFRLQEECVTRMKEKQVLPALILFDEFCSGTKEKLCRELMTCFIRSVCILNPGSMIFVATHDWKLKDDLDNENYELSKMTNYRNASYIDKKYLKMLTESKTFCSTVLNNKVSCYRLTANFQPEWRPNIQQRDSDSNYENTLAKQIEKDLDIELPEIFKQCLLESSNETNTSSPRPSNEENFSNLKQKIHEKLLEID